MALPPNLPWTRYWSQSISDDSEGFLYLPEQHLIPYIEECPRPLDALREVPVLILLGEAGMGKSDALRREHESLKTQEDVLSRHLDLAVFGEEGVLRNRLQSIFEPSSSDTPIIAHLDSFDECLLDIRHLARVLEDVLESMHDRLNTIYLRIACRSAEWPATLSDSLKRLWNIKSVQTWGLCPLQKQDAYQAASVVKIDADQFLELVEEREVESLACRPKTLDYLIGEFRTNGTLPDSRWELYEKGLLQLCKESPDREDSHRGGHLTAKQRCIIASRIATIIIFCNKNGLLSFSKDSIDEGSVSIEQLNGTETDTEPFQVDRSKLEETLRIGGLFDSDIDGIVRFRHRTDAEFLAAWYLDHHQIPTEIKLSLLRDPAGDWLPPQLRGVSAWLAVRGSTIRDWLIREEPVTLLASDTKLDNHARSLLIDTLLRQADTGVSDVRLPTRYLTKLCHPNLIDKVKEIFPNKNQEFMARYLAMELIEACNLEELVFDDLKKILEDTTEHEGPRANAAALIGNLATQGNNNSIDALRIFALDQRPDDPTDRLKGIALEALWPSHLSTYEIFEALTPRKQEYIHGNYAYFPEKIANTLQPDDLPIALKWMSEDSKTRPTRDLYRRRLMDTIMLLAWQHIEEPEILVPFLEAVKASHRRHESLFNRDGMRSDNELNPIDETNKRRIVLQEFINNSLECKQLREVARPFLRNEDISWLIDGIKNASPEERNARSCLIAYQFGFALPDSVIEEILNRAGLHAKDPIPELQQAIARYLVTYIHSETAKREREMANRMREMEAEDRGQDFQPSIRQLLDNAFEHLTASNSNGWAELFLALSFDGNDYLETPGTPITQLPGWNELQESERKRIHYEAERFVQEHSPSRDFNDINNNWMDHDCAAYAAWDFLISLDKPLDISSDALERWRMLLVRYPFVEEEHHRRPVLAWLDKIDRDAFLKALANLVSIDSSNRDTGFHRVREFETVWSSDMATLFLKMADDHSLPFTTRGQLWQALLSRKDALAIQRLRDQALYASKPADQEQAATLLFSHCPAEAWDVLITILEPRDDTAFKVIRNATSQLEHNRNPLDVLSSDQVTKLYSILEKHYPSRGANSKPTRNQCSEVDIVPNIKSYLLHKLQITGAVGNLDKLIKEFSDHQNLKRIRHDASVSAKQIGWKPYAPGELIGFVTDTSRRIVRTDEELMNVIIESLSRLNNNMQSGNPLAPFMWDEQSNKHKPENRLSDFIKFYLDMDLVNRQIVINREVEVRNLSDRGIGERTDLLVQATGNENVYSVIIEVKGDWNRELDEAISSQLYDRYLQASDYRCGLYIAAWTKNSPKKYPSPESLLNSLSEKAEKLSTGEIKISAYVLNIEIPNTKPN